VRAYEAIVAQFDEAIRSGALRPGDRLPSERELVKQFEVGRSTVREALRILQSDGMIRSKPGDPRGPEVIAFSTELLNRPMQTLIQSNRLSLPELIFFRMMTEATIASSAAALGSDPQHAAITDAITAMEAASDAGELETFLTADSAFHDAMAAAAHSRYLVMQNEVVRTAARAYLAAGFETMTQESDYMRTALGSHVELADRIRHRDKGGAAAASHRNILSHYASHLPETEHRQLHDFYLDQETA
jgi:GntR family transcriptional regulator, transcriptional repressor for pyruvate dehydrogenase complex